MPQCLDEWQIRHNSLYELYQRANNGEGWPGEPLKCEPNGHPLTHDLLTRLGALDQSKGKLFEENPDTMQHELWEQNAGYMQGQDASDTNSKNEHPPIVLTRSVSAPTQHHRLTTPPNINHSAREHPTVKTKPSVTATNNRAAMAPLGRPGVHNSIFRKEPQQPQQQWATSSFGKFDDIDMMGTTDFINFSFDDPMNCMVVISRPG